MTIDEIRQFIQLVNESGIAELELQRGEDRVRIKRAPTAADIVVPGGVTAPFPAGVPVLASSPNSAVAPAAPSAASAALAPDNTVLVKSPIVGTFYEAPAPDAPPFVKVGDHVQPGQVLCIIESMKLMNEIEAEASGIIAARLVENGHPVEYGEALFAMRPH
jgi:acetyl-CoA carboxylase biotin carboxyl carrier protein